MGLRAASQGIIAISIALAAACLGYLGWLAAQFALAFPVFVVVDGRDAPWETFWARIGEWRYAITYSAICVMLSVVALLCIVTTIDTLKRSEVG